MYGLVTIELDDRPGLTIPTNALIRRGRDGSGSCFRIVDGLAVLTPIKLGYDDGKRVEVLEGLKEGEPWPWTRAPIASSRARPSRSRSIKALPNRRRHVTLRSGSLGKRTVHRPIP